ncbi:MAG: DUF433 domain-containing protein [Acidobacteriota bacterium]
MARRRFDIYQGRDPRDIPTYSLVEAAHFLQIPKPTLASWIRGRYYPTRAGKGRSEPIIVRPDQDLPLLSFTNLVEAHVLDAIRYFHNVPLKNVRYAVSYLRRASDSSHPLADYWFQLKGVELIVNDGNLVVNATRDGQLEMKTVIRAYLERVARDPRGAAESLYPFLTRHPENVEDQPKIVRIDPRISFGKPFLVGVGVPTAVIADRYQAGENISALARDYGCEASEIENAIRYEGGIRQAA